jgi:uncharacterized protein (UPF0332 family)
MNRLNYYLKEGQIVKDNTVIMLAKRYLEKAESNLETMNILSEINKNNKIRESLNVNISYDSDEWVVITGYYAMYSSALALLAKAGFRSKNHSATILLLEELYTKNKIISKEDLSLLNNALLQKDEIERLSDARGKREIAQYSVTKKTTKAIAENIKKDAYYFIGRVRALIR